MQPPPWAATLKFTSYSSSMLLPPVHVHGAFIHKTKKLWHNPDIFVLNPSRALFPSHPATGRSAKGEFWVEKQVTSPGGCCAEQRCQGGTGIAGGEINGEAERGCALGRVHTARTAPVCVRIHGGSVGPPAGARLCSLELETWRINQQPFL